MSFDTLIKTRQSVRSYLNKSVEQEKLINCIEAARLAPSATNSQPWRFIVVQDKEIKNKIANTTYGPALKFNKFTNTAPCIVVIAANKGNAVQKLGHRVTGLPYYLIDIGIAAEHFCLKATEQGLGTCMIGWFSEKKIKQEIEIHKNEKIALLITVGYPDKDNIRPKNRKDIKDISVFI